MRRNATYNLGSSQNSSFAKGEQNEDSKFNSIGVGSSY